MTEQMDLLIPGLCGPGLYFRLDGFRFIYVCIAVLMWGVSGAFSREYMAHYEKKSRYYWFFWATFLATVGVFLSADLYTTFIFFEIMSFTSYVWVAFDEKKESLRAAETYLAVAVIGGLVMLMGLFLLYDLYGTLNMEGVSAAAAQILAGESAPLAIHVAGGFPSAQVQLYVAGLLMLFGFGAKAGAFPLHIWLPKAHPVAPAPASALLSGILTKAGIFGIIIVSCTMFEKDGAWGLLIAGLGLITMFLGALLALFSTNLKRTLACSSVSQIGFILTGIGMSCLLKWVGEGNLLAVRGTFLHMVNHSLIKLVLFLCAGVVFMNLHQLDLNDIRGFGRRKPALLFCFLMGALGIGGIPLWNGYVSKTLIHEGIVEYIEILRAGVPVLSTGEMMESFLTSPGIWKAAEWVFLFSGGMTVAYMTKLFVVLFVDRHPTRQAEFDNMSGSYMTPLSRTVLVGAAVLLPVLGMLPHQTMDVLADMGQAFFHAGGENHAVAYFSPVNLKGGLISITIGAVLYFLVVRVFLMEKTDGGRQYADRWPAWLDLENLIYRPVLTVALPGIFGTIFEIVDRYLVPTAVKVVTVVLPGIFGTIFEMLDRYLISTSVKVFMSVSAVFCRAMDQMADGTILLARRTTHRQLSEPKNHGEGNWLALIIGITEDSVLSVLDTVSGRKKRYGRRGSSVERMREREKNVKQVAKLVEESFSFGLMLFSIGLCMTLGYLLFIYFRG